MGGLAPRLVSRPAPALAILVVLLLITDLEPYRVYGSHQQAPARH